MDSSTIVCNNISNIFPRHIISCILSFNGYEEHAGKYIRKLDLKLYENIKNYFINRVTLFTSFTRSGVCILIDSDEKSEKTIKVLTINYGYNPVHLLDYEEIAPEMGHYNNQMDPFNHIYPLEYVENTEEETMFYSINNYTITSNNNIIFDNSITYIPQLNAKFEHHPFKSLEILNIDEDENLIREEQDYYVEENYDKEYYENYVY